MAAISAHPNAVTGFAGPGASQPSVLASSPATQRRLLLHGKGQPYQVHVDEEIPQLTFGDLLVEIYAIGLNPIDWKSA